MADERKYAIIDTLDKGDDVLNGLKNSQESITLMTTRNLGLVLSGEIAVDDELKTKFSDLSTKLHTGGSVETKINTIVTDITTKLASVGTPGSIDHQIKDLKDKNEKLNIDITYLNSVR
ncbi:MAG: hypothetical protein LBH96_04525 [Candidatus Peribacteria bacterium]|jgi:hypothetical protein|nr:hypothetical protein [Candidatus Peribacteria bacterium]